MSSSTLPQHDVRRSADWGVLAKKGADIMKVGQMSTSVTGGVARLASPCTRREREKKHVDHTVFDPEQKEAHLGVRLRSVQCFTRAEGQDCLSPWVSYRDQQRIIPLQ